MKTLKTLLFTAIVAGSMVFGFTSCNEDDVRPIEKNGSIGSTAENDAAWD